MSPASTSHLESLKARHAALSQQIEREQLRPGMSDDNLRRLKRQRLRVKEQIEGIF
ncbi:MAG: DUF465 domain-containing protein [Micavibrio sp.]